MWTTRRDSCKNEELRFQDRTAFLMDNLNANTFYKVEVRAHNEIGYSVPSELVFKTAAGKYTAYKIIIIATWCLRNKQLAQCVNMIKTFSFIYIYLPTQSRR